MALIYSLKLSLREYKDICGIYKIECVTGDFYIGSSKNIQQRFFKHRRELRKGIHKNEHLQSAYNKYGEEAFHIEIIQLCNLDGQYIREQFYIDQLKPKYNKELYVVEHRPTEETKQKLSEANRRYYSKPENIAKRYKQIYQFDLSGQLVAEHLGIKPTAAVLDLGTAEINIIRGLNRCLNGTSKTYKGYYWSYDKDFKP